MSVSQTVIRSVGQPAGQPVKHVVSQSVNLSFSYPVSKSVSQSKILLTCKSVYQSTHQHFCQSTSRSVSHKGGKQFRNSQAIIHGQFPKNLNLPVCHRRILTMRVKPT